MKIENDKYYTNNDLAKYCIGKAYEIIGKENISQVIEPSAGNGSFSNQISDCIAYDIQPEHENIIKQDYLTLDKDYKKGSLIIGNPPYGTRNTLSVQFYKKSIKIGDYIAFILPISQLNNNQQMYEFDLIYSEDLKKQIYSDKKIHCCFNIYKRNSNGLNKKPNNKLKDIMIKEYRRGGQTIPNDFEYDVRICSWGNPVGKQVDYAEQYSTEFCIKIYNEKYKEDVLNLLKNTVWEKIYLTVTHAGKLNQWQVYKYIKEQIQGIS